MLKHFLFALPLASLLLVAGCTESTYQSSNIRSSSRSSSTQTAVATPAPQPTYQRPRNSTTQILPAGYGYLHEQDLSGGRLVANSFAPAVTPTVQQPQSQPAVQTQNRSGN